MFVMDDAGNGRVYYGKDALLKIREIKEDFIDDKIKKSN